MFFKIFSESLLGLNTMADDVDEEILAEFRIEAHEAFSTAEDALIELEKGANFSEKFNMIFRCFHSIKGGAGMLGLNALQKAMHSMETLFQAQKAVGNLSKDSIDFFLGGIDGAKKLLDGENTNFNFEKLSPTKTPVASAVISPVKSAPEKAAATQSTPKLPTLNSKFEIFIVDDEPDILEIVNSMLADSGHFTVHQFLSADLALTAFKEHRPDVVMTDLSMPQMTGLDMLKAIRKIDLDVPVVFLSGFLSKEIMYEALHHGAFGFLEKPFKENEVLMMTINAARSRRAQRLLNQSLNFIMYQFSDVDAYLKDSGKELLRASFRTELENLIVQKRALQSLKKAS